MTYKTNKDYIKYEIVKSRKKNSKCIEETKLIHKRVSTEKQTHLPMIKFFELRKKIRKKTVKKRTENFNSQNRKEHNKGES